MNYKLEMRENNGGTYVLLIQDNKFASLWSCDEETVQNFVSDTDPSEWDDQRRYDDPEIYDTPECIGDLLATRQSDGKLVIHEESRYVDRLEFFGLRT